MLVDINDKVDKVTLPTDAEDPVVTEISSDNELLFSVYLYAKSTLLTQEELYDKAVVMEKYLEGKS
jgi:multidrug efflux pump subunit AcrB